MKKTIIIISIFSLVFFNNSLSAGDINNSIGGGKSPIKAETIIQYDKESITFKAIAMNEEAFSFNIKQKQNKFESTTISAGDFHLTIVNPNSDDEEDSNSFTFFQADVTFPTTPTTTAGVELEASFKHNIGISRDFFSVGFEAAGNGTINAGIGCSAASVGVKLKAEPILGGEIKVRIGNYQTHGEIILKALHLVIAAYAKVKGFFEFDYDLYKKEVGNKTYRLW